jgi:hypothetical protein
VEKSEPLTADDIQQLERLSLVLAPYCIGPGARGKYETSFGKLNIVQELLSERNHLSWSTDEIKSMGVLVGEALIQDLEMEWAITSRDGSREPVVRLPGTNFVVYAVRTIRDHLGPQVPLDVFELFAGLTAKIRDTKSGKAPDQFEY